MAETSVQFIEQLVLMLLDLAQAKVLPKIDSSTLRAALTQIVAFAPESVIGRLHIPHYWAVYYHDGRRGFDAPEGRFLVFYADHRDDPRLRGGRPVRQSDVRRLTKTEFIEGLRKNRERKARGDDPFMYAVKSVKKADPHPFFTDGMVGFGDEVGPDITRSFDDYMRRQAREHDETARVIFTLS